MEALPAIGLVTSPTPPERIILSPNDGEGSPKPHRVATAILGSPEAPWLARSFTLETYAQSSGLDMPEATQAIPWGAGTTGGGGGAGGG